MRLIHWLLCLPALVPAITAAQNVRPVDCRFLWFDAAVPPPVLVNTVPGAADVRCQIAGNKLSPVFRCFAAEGEIRFLNEEDRSVVATAKVAADVKSAILVILPAPKPAAGVPAVPGRRIYVIDESPGKFPDGGALIANFYNSDIRFVVGEHRNQLRAGGNHAVKQPEKRDNFNMAPVIVQFQHGEKWRTASESTLRFIPEVRYLILAHIDPATGRPRIATFTDNQAVAPAAVE